MGLPHHDGLGLGPKRHHIAFAIVAGQHLGFRGQLALVGLEHVDDLAIAIGRAGVGANSHRIRQKWRGGNMHDPQHGVAGARQGQGRA